MNSLARNMHQKMLLKLIVVMIGATHILANTLSTGEYNKHQDEQCGAMAIKMMFSKLDIIMLKSRQTTKLFTEFNERLDELTKSVNNIKMELEDYTKSQKVPLVQQTFQNQLHNQIATSIKNSLNQSWPTQECSKKPDWTVIQRRLNGSIDFNRGWAEYKKGFGNPNGEFFIGLDKLHVLTAKGQPQELWIVLKDFDDQIRYAIYDKFVVGSEAEKYVLKELGDFRGTAGDSLTFHVGLQFSTKDEGSCSDRFQSAWWFKPGILEECYRSNLNGPYLRGINDIGGAVWGSFHNWNYSLKFIEMSIRSAQ